MKVLICLFACIAASLAQIDYCAVRNQFCCNDWECKSIRDHIACLPNNFTPTGTVTNVVPLTLTQAQKDLIVAKHNQWRQKLANGEFASINFPSASKLKAMAWHNNLEYVAGVHAAYGEFKHDSCRATPEFRYSGQNLAALMSTSNTTYPSLTNTINNGIDNWFNEIYVADPRLVTKMESAYVAPAGHFSVMVNDRNNFVGCGASQFRWDYGGKVWSTVMLTCNYEFTNMIGSATYTAGTPCSQCTSGCSATYPGLCA